MKNKIYLFSFMTDRITVPVYSRDRELSSSSLGRSAVGRYALHPTTARGQHTVLKFKGTLAGD
jgi:hypothetical protein